MHLAFIYIFVFGRSILPLAPLVGFFLLLTHMPLYIFPFPPPPLHLFLHLPLTCMPACAMIWTSPSSSSKRSTQKHPMPSPSLRLPTRPDPPTISTAQTRVTVPTTTLPTGLAATVSTAPLLLPAPALALMSSAPAAPATKMVSQPFLFFPHVGFLPLTSTNPHQPLT